MKHIEIQFLSYGPAVAHAVNGFVEDSDYEELDKLFKRAYGRITIDIYPANEKTNPKRHHINLNAVMYIVEMPD